jgi:hypothetical protein
MPERAFFAPVVRDKTRKMPSLTSRLESFTESFLWDMVCLSDEKDAINLAKGTPILNSPESLVQARIL